MKVPSSVVQPPRFFPEGSSSARPDDDGGNLVTGLWVGREGLWPRKLALCWKLTGDW
jgi:hypothetical protein